MYTNITYACVHISEVCIRYIYIYMYIHIYIYFLESAWHGCILCLHTYNVRMCTNLWSMQKIHIYLCIYIYTFIFWSRHDMNVYYVYTHISYACVHISEVCIRYIYIYIYIYVYAYIYLFFGVGMTWMYSISTQIYRMHVYTFMKYAKDTYIFMYIHI